MDLFKDKKSVPFWMLTFFVIAILVVSQLVQDGMFMDGLLYTVVGKNLADGRGSFWDPRVSETIMYSFHEQPPLYFGILAVFYKLFGSSMYVERLFCFVFFSGTAWYIHRLWKKIHASDPATAALSWLPVLFWVTIPVCFWAYSNHVEEMVMAFFALAAAYHIFIAADREEYVIRNLIIAGVFIFLSSLTKGVQGLFPLAGVAAYWLASKKLSFRKMILYSLLLIAVPALIYGTLLLSDPKVYDSYHTYFSIRYTRAFNGAESTTDNRFWIIGRLFMELLPLLLLSALFLFFTGKYKSEDLPKARNSALLWVLLIGLSGSLPLMVTLAQRGFYLVTSLPFFAIVLAMLIAPRAVALIGKMDSASKSFRIFRQTTIALLIAAAVYTGSCFGKAKRDDNMLADVYQMGAVIPQSAIVAIPSGLTWEWSLRYYFLRYFYISLDAKSAQHRYYITWKKYPLQYIPEGYVRFPIDTKELDLYIQKSGSSIK